MSQDWNTPSKPKPVLNVDGPDDWQERQSEGIDAAITRYSGTDDPSLGAGWGAPEVGLQWLDLTDEYNPVLWEWARFDTGGTDYGFRKAELRSVYVPEPEEPVTMPFASPAGADEPWTELDLSALLLTLVDSNFQRRKPVEVVLDVTVTADAAETLDGTNGYLAFRMNGGTGDRRVQAQVPAIPNSREITLPLDTAAKLEVMLVVGGGTPSFAFSVTVVEVRERM